MIKLKKKSMKMPRIKLKILKNKYQTVNKKLQLKRIKNFINEKENESINYSLPFKSICFQLQSHLTKEQSKNLSHIAHLHLQSPISTALTTFSF